MKKYYITGMSCAACQSRIEKAVTNVTGVTEVSVNLLTNSMQVEGNASDNDIINAVENAGYGIEYANIKKQSNNSTNILAETSIEMKSNRKSSYDNFRNSDTLKLRNRLVSSLIFMIPLMYLSMGYTMWNLPLPKPLAENYIGITILQMLLAGCVMIINQKFFTNGFKGIIHKAPNMDTLVALGSSASFVYSVCILFVMTYEQSIGNVKQIMHHMHDLYFESAAMILTLITVGKMLESYSKGKTTDALKGLMDLTPKIANLISADSDGNEIIQEVPVEQVKVGDIFVVKPGENIPVDGVIIDGHTSIDESALTGESIPVDKNVEDKVSSATINQSGYIKCRATRVGEDTTLSQIIQMVSDASATKAPIAKIADKVSFVFVPVVISLAVVTFIIWILFGYDISFALARGISVLVISCPCALGLATPVAIMVGSGRGAKNGILFKNATTLENTGKADIVVLDKTGTITTGKPRVTDIILNSNISEQELLTVALSLEIKSEHPLASAIVEYCKDKKINAIDVKEFKIEAGNGLCGYLDGSRICGGNIKYISRFTNNSDLINETRVKLSSQGKTPLYFVKNDYLLGIIAVADIVKKDSFSAVNQLNYMGIEVVMLTGDNTHTAQTIAKEAGISNVIAEVLPDEKQKVVLELSKLGKVIMVGDGVNDAPALTQADIGMAIGAGSDIAIDAANVVLVKNSLLDVVKSIRLSRAVIRNIHENLFWAFIYNIIGIPLAAGMWYPIFGIKLNPMFGALAMSLSSFCVVTNALRLNWINLLKHNKINKNHTIISEEISKLNIKNKENNIMKKIIKINGMMCCHCEENVKNTLEAIDGVVCAEVSHENNKAIVTLDKEIDNDIFKNAIIDKGYDFESIEEI